MVKLSYPIPTQLKKIFFPFMGYANNEKIKQKQLTNNKLELLIPTKKIKKTKSILLSVLYKRKINVN